MKFLILSIASFCVVLAPTFSHAAYTIRNGKIIHKDEVATTSVQEHYSMSLDARQKKKWDEVVSQNTIIIKNFPESPFAEEAVFYLGEGYFHVKEYELANEQFSKYLKKPSTPKHFEEAMEYKFFIAEEYKKGVKKRLLGWKKMPKIQSAKEEALAIYEEVIMTLPNHEYAIQSLFGKAEILREQEEFRTCIETYQTLIRRFSKHPLAPESYLGIAKSYLFQCKNEFPDPDFLDLAEINLRKFTHDFPKEERIELAKEMLSEMKEIYAKSLYEVAQFYERTKKEGAAKLYYLQIVTKYPNTKLAEASKKRVDVITTKLEIAAKEKEEKERKELAKKQAEAPAVETIAQIETSSQVEEIQTCKDIEEGQDAGLVSEEGSEEAMAFEESKAEEKVEVLSEEKKDDSSEILMLNEKENASHKVEEEKQPEFSSEKSLTSEEKE